MPENSKNSHDYDDLELLFPSDNEHPEESNPDDMSVEAQSPMEDHAVVNDPVRNSAIVKIEKLFESFVDSLLNDENELCLSLPARPTSNRDTVPSTRHIRFPGKTTHGAWRFSTHVRVLELMHEALVDGVVTTKRDIFYKDPALFVRQSVVDRIVDDISFALSIPRACLNVSAAAKGLVAGSLSITRADDFFLDASQNAEGSLIPMLQNGDTIEIRGAKWILVIEKEAVFRSLLSSDTWTILAKQGIAITGKGYPDVATRVLLQRLAAHGCHHRDRLIPVYGLADYDPDGMGILSTYKHGSMSLQHENDLLRVPNLQRLGLKSDDVLGSYDDIHKQCLLPLSARDRRKSSKMLEWDAFGEGKDTEDWRRELQVMLMLNFKAEIELIEAEMEGIGEWLAKKLVPV